MKSRLAIVATLGVVVTTACGSGTSESASPPESTPYLEAAIEAGQWLVSGSREGQAAELPDRVDADEMTTGLGSGAAGRAVFFAELFSATGDSSYLAMAIATARSTLEGLDRTPVDYGLYGGLSGVAAAVAEVAAVSGNTRLRSEARMLFTRVAQASQARDGVTGWGDAYDVLAGKAGIGLSLMYAFEEFGDWMFLQAAIAAGDDLLDVAEPMAEGGTRWLRGASTPLDLPNFSHGTAGAGFFMARLGAVSGLDRFNAAARSAVAYLDRIAEHRDGLFLIPYGVPNDGYVTRYDIGWAHGPAGAARIHYALWSATGEQGMADRVDASARTILASGVPGASADSLLWTGPFRIDRRFGTSGAAAFLLDWGAESGNNSYLEGAGRIVDDILGRATRGEDGITWRVPLYGFQGSGEDAVFTGYFFGSAGLGLTLLHQHYVLAGRLPAIRLPDDPFPRHRQR